MQLEEFVQVTVKVALVVFGEIAPNTAPDDDPLNPIPPSCVKVHPGAVAESPRFDSAQRPGKMTTGAAKGAARGAK